jgi:RNA ligase (TIGR02306 family)
MATFKVSLEKIATSIPHPNADRLSLCTLEGMGFQFVTGRNEFKEGDLVLYYPIDSILPQERIEALNLVGKLAGKEKNRIKTVRLRNAISQGIVEPAYNWPGAPAMALGSDFTTALGVTKWEPDAVSTKNATLLPIGTIGLSVYDIEGADRFPQVVDLLMDTLVQVTEKLEGANLSVTARKDKRTLVGSRNNVIMEDEGKEHPMCKVARDQGLVKAAEEFLVNFRSFGGLPAETSVTIYGEYIGEGVQKNIYNLKGNQIRCFDVKIDGNFKDVVQTNLLWVPVLAQNITLREFLAGRTIQEASNGQSVLAPGTRREGIVIKPMVEQRHPTLGRLILKQRSPEYLAKSDL